MFALLTVLGIGFMLLAYPTMRFLVAAILANLIQASPNIGLTLILYFGTFAVVGLFLRWWMKV